ncbi:hypothetical protein LCGC14_0369750 [marine sediment metagenome]|uniref:ERF family protein n=1 Tax=marine sediment metagenome TaxID=412755 RepID=A0A0F9VSN1_9ZZZZ
MKKSDTIGELAQALVQVQKVLEGAKKDSTNPFFKSKYADLSSVWDACRKPLAENNLAVIQTMDTYEGAGFIIETTLAHISGEWISGRLSITPVKDDPQGIGSAITYGRRYTLAAIVGVCPEDDDAESAMDRKGKAVQTTSAPSQGKEPIPEGEPRTSPGVREPVTRKSLEERIKGLLRAQGIKGVNQLADYLKENHFAETSIENLSDDGLTGLVTLLGKEVEPKDIPY